MWRIGAHEGHSQWSKTEENNCSTKETTEERITRNDHGVSECVCELKCEASHCTGQENKDTSDEDTLNLSLEKLTKNHKRAVIH